MDIDIQVILRRDDRSFPHFAYIIVAQASQAALGVSCGRESLTVLISLFTITRSGAYR